MKEIKPIYAEDYEETYGVPDYNGKNVLEIGADHGSTAYFFFKKGAKSVVSVESNVVFYLKMMETKKDVEGWEPIQLHISKREELKNLIEKHKPDIMHLDCEGCEKFLLEVPNEVLSTVPLYQIEIHTIPLHDEFIKKFNELGYKLVNDYWYVPCPCYITVWRK